jgi:hypothetical protein
MCKYEVRQVDALASCEEGMWEYNETWHLFDFTAKGKDDRKSFKRALNRHGIKLTPKCQTYSPDGSLLEVVERKTQMPLFCAIPLE